jgi:hypothetical protein
MTTRPIHTKGILQKTGASWHIILSEDHPSFEDSMPAELVLWDARSEGKKSEVEEIARIQQLEPSIVALALAAEGSLSGSEFAKK